MAASESSGPAAPDPPAERPEGYDPYSNADSWPILRERPRRTLDDMRRLSEQIKLSRRQPDSRP